MWLIVFAATTCTTSTTARKLPITSPCWSKSNDGSRLTTNRCLAPYSTPPAVLALGGGAGADRQVAALSSSCMYDYNLLLHANLSSDVPKPRGLPRCPQPGHLHPAYLVVATSYAAPYVRLPGDRRRYIHDGGRDAYKAEHVLMDGGLGGRLNMDRRRPRRREGKGARSIRT